jgi:hypothetical protein
MSRFFTAEGIARHTNNHINSIKHWVSQGYVTAYKTGDGKFVFDLDEVLKAIETNPRIRDKRNPFGERARVVPLPPSAQIGKVVPRAEVVPPKTAEAS